MTTNYDLIHDKNWVVAGQNISQKMM